MQENNLYLCKDKTIPLHKRMPFVLQYRATVYKRMAWIKKSSRSIGQSSPSEVR